MNRERSLTHLLLGAVLISIACGGSSNDCPSGNGRLAVVLAGIPTGAAGSVVLTSASGTQTVAGSETVTLASGSYTFSAPLITAPDPRVRKAYTPAFSQSSVQICGDADSSLTVTWSLLPTSNKIFFENENAADDLLAFAADDFAASGSALPALQTTTRAGASAAAFDKEGNLWVADSISGSEAVERYPAAQFASGGVKVPDTVIESSDFSGGSPGLDDIAFDPAGNLWVSVPYANQVVRLDASSLVRAGTVSSTAKITGYFGPLAFDASGTLWIGADDHVVAFTSAHLTGTASEPDIDVQAKTPGPVVSTLSGAQGLAFDGSGTLWVNYNGSIARLGPGDRASSGTVTPAVILQLSVAALPVGLAFDESGDLCMALGQGQVGCFASAQLAASGTVSPTVVISSATLGSAISPVLFPAPAATPLFAALP